MMDCSFLCQTTNLSKGSQLETAEAVITTRLCQVNGIGVLGSRSLDDERHTEAIDHCGRSPVLFTSTPARLPVRLPTRFENFLSLYLKISTDLLRPFLNEYGVRSRLWGCKITINSVSVHQSERLMIFRAFVGWALTEVNSDGSRRIELTDRHC